MRGRMEPDRLRDILAVLLSPALANLRPAVRFGDAAARVQGQRARRSFQTGTQEIRAATSVAVAGEFERHRDLLSGADFDIEIGFLRLPRHRRPAEQLAGHVTGGLRDRPGIHTHDIERNPSPPLGEIEPLAGIHFQTPRALVLPRRLVRPQRERRAERHAVHRQQQVAGQQVAVGRTVRTHRHHLETRKRELAIRIEQHLRPRAAERRQMPPRRVMHAGADAERPPGGDVFLRALVVVR